MHKVLIVQNGRWQELGLIIGPMGNPVGRYGPTFLDGVFHFCDSQGEETNNTIRMKIISKEE